MAAHPNEQLDVVATLSKENVFTRQYSEEDIAALEQADLTDPLVGAALKIGYKQNDPNEAEFFGFRSDPAEGVYGSQAKLEEMLESVEQSLKAQPKDYDLRTRRLAILTHMACLREHEARKRRTERAVFSPADRGEPLRERT